LDNPHPLCESKTQQDYLLDKIPTGLSESVLRNVYLAKFESVLKYGIFWGGAQKDSETLFKLQKVWEPKYLMAFHLN
jgi:hypothetical protein